MNGAAGIEAVVFDLDGVLIDSEGAWDRARRQVAAEHGGHWLPAATAAMQGMSSLEWGRYLHHEIGVALDEAEIIDQVARRLLAGYEAQLPLLPGALEAVRDLGRRWPLALASSSNRAVIDRVLDLAGLEGAFAVTLSSEEVARGKPAADVYLEVFRRLDVTPSRSVAVEDSANGIRAAMAAGSRVVAVPRPEVRPPEALLARAWLVLASLEELTADRLSAQAAQQAERSLDEAELESFPASDPHADWAGPPD